MFIRSVRVRNFRSILDESLPCDSLTALVGRNGSGKSSFLSALELFYDSSAKVTAEDFFAEDLTQQIEVWVTFIELSDEARDLFSAYLEEDSLTVVRVFSTTEGGKPGTYHGMRLQNPDFSPVRNAGGNAAVRSAYSELRKTEKYSILPSARSADAARDAMEQWESNYPKMCSSQLDDGQFFGFTQVGQGYLGRFTRFIHIPAVRDAEEDATDKRGSCITEIMDLTVRNVLASRKDLTDFKEQTQTRYREILDPGNLTELSVLERSLSEALQSYAPDSGVLLQWSELEDIEVPMPQAQVKLVEDGYQATVQRTGHGLQRAFILTMLQRLAAAREVSDESEAEDSETQMSSAPLLPNLVLAIEEPELYQHPSSQRHLASVLMKLASGVIPGVAKETQVIYATHSPLFVGLDRFDQIRVLRKTAHEIGEPKATSLEKADMDAVAGELKAAKNSDAEVFTADTLRPRLHALMTPWMNEGFFADIAVLVEGEDDRAAILGVAKSMNDDFDSMGVAIIPCFGKASLDRPLVIFRQLGIPVYVVWDGDHGEKDAKAEQNKYLLRLLDEPEQDWPDFVGPTCACFKVKLETTLSDEIGSDLLNQLLAEAQKESGISKKDQALKNPSVIQRVIEQAASKGKTSKSLTNIVESIVALKTNAKG